MNAPARSPCGWRSLREVRKRESLGEPNILPLRTACGPAANGPAWQGSGNLQRPSCAAKAKDEDRCNDSARSQSRKGKAQEIWITDRPP